jgi:chemotaxis protein MotB
MGEGSLAPIIVRRRRKSAQPVHHGGAWKVAYADFVTAMMAFFLLMWLLNATTEQQRKGLADYFAPVLRVSPVSGGGDGVLFGDSALAEDILAQDGTGASLMHPSALNKASGDIGANDPASSSDVAARAASEQLLEQLHARGGEAMARLQDMRHVISRVTDEGVVIDIFDRPGSPLFTDRTAEPRPLLRMTLATVAEVLALVSNDVAVNAHVGSQPIVLRENPVWEMTADRADMARVLIEQSGFPSERIQRVTGYADRKPVDADPMALRNSRIEIIVLRSLR